jgi:hypothetical protein
VDSIALVAEQALADAVRGLRAAAPSALEPAVRFRFVRMILFSCALVENRVKQIKPMPKRRSELGAGIDADVSAGLSN